MENPRAGWLDAQGSLPQPHPSPRPGQGCKTALLLTPVWRKGRRPRQRTHWHDVAAPQTRAPSRRWAGRTQNARLQDQDQARAPHAARGKGAHDADGSAAPGLARPLARDTRRGSSRLCRGAHLVTVSMVVSAEMSRRGLPRPRMAPLSEPAAVEAAEAMARMGSAVERGMGGVSPRELCWRGTALPDDSHRSWCGSARAAAREQARHARPRLPLPNPEHPMASAPPAGAAELRAAFLSLQVPHTETVRQAEAWIKDFWMRKASPAAFFFLLEHDKDDSVRAVVDACRAGLAFQRPASRGDVGRAA